MERLLLFSTVLTIFLLSGILTQSLDPQTCINSKYVNKLVIVGLEKGVGRALESCEFNKIFSDENGYIRRVYRLQNRIESLDRLIALVPLRTMKSKIGIHLKEPFLYDSGYFQQSVGLELAEARIEEIVLGHVLQSVNFQARQDTYYKWVLVNFLNRTLQGGGGELNSLDTYFKSFKDYCFSGKIPVEHIVYCEYQNSGPQKGLKTLNEITAWSVQPFISGFLSKYYEDLKLPEKKAFLTGIEIQLKSNKPIEFSGLWPDSPRSVLSYHKWVKDYLHKMIVSFSDKTEAVEKRFENLTYLFNLNKKNQADLFIINQTPYDGLRLLNKKLATEKFRNIIYKKGGKLFYYPNFSGISEMLINELTAKKVLILKCGPIRASDLRKYQNISSRLIYIKWCGEDMELTAEGILNREKSPLVSHAKVPFVRFYLPGVKLAQMLWGYVNEDLTIPKLKKWLRWEKMADNRPLEKIYHPRAPIDVVTAFNCPVGDCVH